MRIPAPALPFLLRIALLPAFGSATLAGEGGDFTTWSPPERRPEFRELIKGDEYALRMRAALALIDVPALEASKAPAAGYEITKVDEGGQADRNGIGAGDYIVEMDGLPLAYDWQFDALRKDRTQTLGIRRADGSAKSVEVLPGRIGVWYRTQRAPELDYVRGPKRSPAWEDEVLVGITRQCQDPPLAETAWHHAIAKGYEPDALSDEMGAHIAASRGRYEEAMAFAWLALRADPKRTRAANVLAEIALASFKLDLGLRTLKEHPEIVVSDLRPVEELIAGFRLHAMGRKDLAPATALADRKGRRDLFEVAKPLNSLTGYYVGFLRRGSAFLSPPRGKYIPIVFGPAAADVEMVIRFSAQGLGDEKLTGCFQIGWLDQGQGEFDKCTTCGHIHNGFGLEMNESKGVKIHHYVPAMETTRTYHDVSVERGGENLLRLVVCDRQCEAFLNGRRLYHGPWPAEVKRLVPCLKAVSMKVWIHEISVSELTDGPAPAPVEKAGEDEVF